MSTLPGSGSFTVFLCKGFAAAPAAGYAADGYDAAAASVDAQGDAAAISASSA